MDLCYFHEENSEDLSYCELDDVPEFLVQRSTELSSLILEHNNIISLPRSIGLFVNLVSLDISHNGLAYISPEICNLVQLRTFTARNNALDMESLPKDFGAMPSLQVLNLGGNSFADFPMQITELPELRYLYMGSNRIENLPKEIGNLSRLQVLYLGGNQLETIPEEVGQISNLASLVLCDNRLTSLPNTLGKLRSLQSLSLHNNRLCTLPPEIVRLKLIELSLRNNPLVARFAQDLTYESPSLLELAGRVIKVKSIQYSVEDLPDNLIKYLESAQSCVNPKCKGVYFSSRVEHVKFVDFCGKYRLPLLQYLCSPKCTTAPSVVGYSSESESEDEAISSDHKIRKVLLG